MTLNKLTEKVMPPLMVAAVLTMSVAVVELRGLSIKIEYLEKAMLAYHEERE